ncbi:MAG TPA: glycosyltransferase [Gemmataceae bacterium]|nr:glycosyltransferase [Gemmataceae bacterium]
MKILFVMDRRPDRGSIQAVANYVRAGDRLGHPMAVYGRDDPHFPGVRFTTDVGGFDYAVFVNESWRHWMSGLRMPRLMAAFPRDRRAMLDADGMYNPVVSVDGYDRNLASEWERAQWRAHYELVTDKVLQPTFEPIHSGVRSLPFYGYDPASQLRTRGAKRYDVLHVGHNWWRWRQISSELLPALECVRDRVGEVCFMGSWWDAAPVGAKMLDLEAAFGVDPERFRRLGIQTRPAVPFTEVIAAMSTAKVNLMTQRPLFRRLRLLTSKFFEIVCADTVPLVMIDPDHAASVYGPAGRELALHGDGIADKLLDVLGHPGQYAEIVNEVRRHLVAHHSYEVRVRQLVAALAD